MNDLVVSVIVLTYNQQHTIGATLDSILAQQAPFGYEIVVGEDASTDATRRVCEDYARRYPGVVRLMPQSPNKGLVRNYFDCLAACRGRYIADCSGDDRWVGTDRLARQVELLEEHPGASAVSSDWLVNGRQVEAADKPDFSDFLTAEGALPMQLSASVYRADIIREALANGAEHVCRPDFGCEDLPVALALLAAGPIVRLPLVALEYTDADGSVSHPSDATRAWDYHFRTLRCRLELAAAYGVDRQSLRTTLQRRAAYLTTLTFRLGDPARLQRLRELAPLPLTAKARLLNALMTSRPLWRLTRSILLALRP